MTKQTTLVVAVDYTGCGWEVTDVAANLAEKLEANVVLTYVVHLPNGVPPELELHTDSLKRSEQLLDEDAQAALRDMAAVFKHKKIPCQLDLRHGTDIAHRVLDAAKEHEADFLVTGTHGRTGIKRMVLGSVAERIIREAPCPVVTVRTQDLAAHPGMTEAQKTVAAEADG